MEPVNLEDIAIVARPETDNTAVVAVECLEKGTSVQYRDEVFKIAVRVLRGQSFAIRSAPHGQPYVPLGDPLRRCLLFSSAGAVIDETNLDGMHEFGSRRSLFVQHRISRR